MAKNEATERVDTAAVDGKSSARGPRSPNFPGISLADALAKTKILYDKDRRATVSPKTILKHFGFGENVSGSSARVISALRQFGLLDDVADNYRVSESAYHILTLSDGPKKAQLIQDSAQKPAIYRDVLRQYPDGLPSDDAMRDYLILEKKFNPASVDTFLRVFKASLAFAKVSVGEYNGGDIKEPVNVGDFAQWESQGVDQFEVPKKVVGLSEDGTYAFIEGEATGFPLDQLIKAEPPAPVLPPRVAPASPHVVASGGGSKLPSGVAREVSDLAEGEAMLQWPASLSPESVQDLEDWLALVIKKLKRRHAPGGGTEGRTRQIDLADES